MTNNIQDQQISLQDLTYFPLPNGTFCFVADRDNIEEIVESLGFQIYYLIAHQKTVDKTKSSTTTTYQQGKPVTTNVEPTYIFNAKIFKVVNNFVGRSVTPVEEDFGVEIASVEEEASYSMPPIPKIIIDKLDEFFRLVHAKHGTESIVLLTYDTTKEGSDGWGVLVPDQTNTAAHCKYDPDSVAALKEDHIMIVGSVHSHPEMPAYASGTDHDDQSDFDGVHITYGWQRSVSNGATQYHIELQIAGNSYSLKIEDVFESYTINKEPDPDVIVWSDKVKKSLPPSPSQAGVITSYNNQAYIPGGTRFVEKRVPFFPFDKMEYNGLLAAEIDTTGSGTMICPACQVSLFKNEIGDGKGCPGCDIALVPINLPIQETITCLDKYQEARKLDTHIPYYLWIYDVTTTLDCIINLKPKDEIVEYDDKPLSLLEEADDIPLTATDDYEEDEYDSFGWREKTLCCGVELNDYSQFCNCEKTVLGDFVIDFDEKLSDLNQHTYLNGSICEGCAHYYVASCTPYREAVVKFAIDGSVPEQPFSGCAGWESYKVSDSFDKKVLSKEELSEWEIYGA